MRGAVWGTPELQRRNIYLGCETRYAMGRYQLGALFLEMVGFLQRLVVVRTE